MNLESVVQTLIKISTAGASAGYIEEAEDVLTSLEQAVPDTSAPCIALVNAKLLDRDFEGAQKLINKYKARNFEDSEAPLLGIMEVFIKMMNNEIEDATELLASMDIQNHPSAQKAMNNIAKDILNNN